MERRQEAFSLVEVAIVIAIIGLLAGGIIGGQALIGNAKLGRVITDASQYAESMKMFKQQYAYLPGDFPTATEVWGRADGGTPITSNCAAPATTASVGKTTCNGNGNGTFAVETDNEPFRAWQHLSAAGFIGGNYTGIAASGVAHHTIPGSNAPKGPLDNSGFFLWNWGNVGDDGTFYAGDYSITLAFGATTANSWPQGEVLSSTEAQSIDTKADDGAPGRGAIRTIFSYSTSCTTSTSSTTAAYALSSTGPACTMLFTQTYRGRWSE